MVGQWRTLVGWRSRPVVQSRPRGAVVFRYLATTELQAFFEHICSFIHPPIHLQVRSFIYSIHKSKVIEIFVYSRCLIVEKYLLHTNSDGQQNVCSHYLVLG